MDVEEPAAGASVPIGDRKARRVTRVAAAWVNFIDAIQSVDLLTIGSALGDEIPIAGDECDNLKKGAPSFQALVNVYDHFQHLGRDNGDTCGITVFGPVGPESFLRPFTLATTKDDRPRNADIVQSEKDITNRLERLIPIAAELCSLEKAVRRDRNTLNGYQLQIIALVHECMQTLADLRPQLRVQVDLFILMSLASAVGFRRQIETEYANLSSGVDDDAKLAAEIAAYGNGVNEQMGSNIRDADTYMRATINRFLALADAIRKAHAVMTHDEVNAYVLALLGQRDDQTNAASHVASSHARSLDAARRRDGSGTLADLLYRSWVSGESTLLDASDGDDLMTLAIDMRNNLIEIFLRLRQMFPADKKGADERFRSFLAVVLAMSTGVRRNAKRRSGAKPLGYTKADIMAIVQTAVQETRGGYINYMDWIGSAVANYPVRSDDQIRVARDEVLSHASILNEVVAQSNVNGDWWLLDLQARRRGSPSVAAGTGDSLAHYFPGGGVRLAGVTDAYRVAFITMALERIAIRTNGGRLFRWLLTKNCFVPISLIGWTPHERFRAGSMVVAVPGSELGNTFVGPSDWQMGRDTQRKMINAHYTLKMKSLVMNPDLIEICPNVLVVGYGGGAGHVYWQPYNSDDVQRYKSSNINGRDMFITAVPPDWTPPCFVMDITGRFNPEWFNNGTESNQLHYPTAPAYTMHWGFHYGVHQLKQRYETVEHPRTNTVCLQRFQRVYEYTGSAVSSGYTRHIVSKGHNGPRVYPGSADARNGMAMYLAPVNYDKTSSMAVVY